MTKPLSDELTTLNLVEYVEAFDVVESAEYELSYIAPGGPCNDTEATKARLSVKFTDGTSWHTQIERTGGDFRKDPDGRMAKLAWICWKRNYHGTNAWAFKI